MRMHQITDNAKADVATALRTFREGDAVRAVVLALDSEKQRISLGLKPSYFADDEQGPEDDKVLSEGDGVPSDSDGDAMDEDKESENSDSDDDDDDSAMLVDGETLQPLHQSTVKTVIPLPGKAPQDVASALNLQGGFQWGGMNNPTVRHEEGSESEDESASESDKKKKKKKKKIEYDVTGEMHTKTPDSVSDFERRLLSSPNSSYMWIQYMSFQLQLSEIDKAREIGRRALKTMNFREEQERLNVWIALLNIENSFGTDDTLDSAFKEASKACDSKTIHLRLAAILDQSSKSEVCELILRFRPITELYDRKPKSNTNAQARNLARAPKCGHYLESIICVEVNLKTPESCYLEAYKVSKSESVSSSSAMKTTPIHD